MDYAKPPKYYDTFALRDAEGQETVMQTWPYFRSRASRSALKSNRPVPVTSCWNGMGKLDSPPSSEFSFKCLPVQWNLGYGSIFLEQNALSYPVYTNKFGNLSLILVHFLWFQFINSNFDLSFLVFMDAGPFYDKSPPLRFRGIPDSLAKSHLEASECCLIHADNDLTSHKGVWVNPNVRVGYTGEAYSAVQASRRWLTTYDMLCGIWQNRLRRWTTTSWFKRRLVSSRLRTWRKTEPHLAEPGAHCLINEMQVLVSNGWAHV